MSEQELTPWFPPEVKPARKGVYQRDYPFDEVFYARWDGKNWHTYWDTPQMAAQSGRGISRFQELPWRGLAKDPSQ